MSSTIDEISRGVRLFGFFISIGLVVTLISFSDKFSSVTYIKSSFQNIGNVRTAYNHVPTMYPTEAAPTAFPVLSPTLYPTEPHPTMFPTEQSPTSLLEAKKIKFSACREGYDILPYFELNPNRFLKYAILSNYTGVVEPYASMSICMLNQVADDSVNYKYTICDADGVTDCTVYDISDSFSIPCQPKDDTYYVSIQQYDVETDEETDVKGDGYFMCMYVRREFRALTEYDLNRTMDAMWQMWALEEAEGQELYGEDFHNYARLLEYHYFNAAWKDADHIHEGNGFLAQHIKMDMIFEKSMQAIDPYVSLPYWDFTIENATETDVWDSPLFTPQTFGSLNLPKDMIRGWTYENDVIEDGAIPDGRWKNFRADVNSIYPDLFSAYGYMRAPWNMNPANVITRFTSIDKWLPNCEAHYKLLSYTLLSDFLFQVPYGAHASVHGVLGGVYGCDLFDPLLEAGYIIDEQAKLNLCKNWIFYLKEFYRDNLITPKKNCTSVDEKGEFSTAYEHQSCGYECEPDFLNILLLQLKSVLNSDYVCVDSDNMPNEGWFAWKDFVCSGDGYKIFGGDHLESASPADPSFWPIHPTLERLAHARFMAGGFDTTEWPSDPVNEYVCNKHTCYDESQATNDDARAPFGAWESCCYGHYQDDQLMDAPNGDRYTGVGPTNREIFMWIDPRNVSYGLTHIYDSFEWPHCEDRGYSFSSLLEYLYVNVSQLDYNTSQLEDVGGKGWR